MKDAIKREQNDACINSVEREHARPTVNVKDIFALRKQGKIEEAYDAIRPIYREHKGKFTTLCMFWTAADVFKLRLDQGRLEEAEKIYKVLQRLIPSIEDDKEKSAAGFMHYAEGRLIKASEKFRKRYFSMKKRKGQCLTTPPLAPPLERRGDIPSDNPSDNPSLNHGQFLVLDTIKANEGINVPGIVSETGIPAKSIERHIKVLIERNLIEHRGSKKTGGYHAL